MKRVTMEGKRKRKSGVFSPELGVAKTGFHCEQSIGVDYSDEEDDGVHGGRMRPLASLEVNRHLLLGKGLHGGFANSPITKKTVSPSAVTAAAKITARAREKARICLLEDNKENAFPKGATGFRPFRGIKRKVTPEGCRTKALQATNLDSPGKILNASDLGFQAGRKDGSKATDDAYIGGVLQFPCKSNSAWTEPAEVQTVSVQLSQCPNSNRSFDTDALCSESVLQSSQDSSKPVLLALGEKARKPESIATPVHAACSEVEQALHGSREGSINVPPQSRLVHKTLVNDGPTGTTAIRPVALPLNAEAHPIKMGPSSLRQIRHQLSCGSMQESSSPSISKHASPGIGRRHGELKTNDHPTYQDSSVSHVQNVMPSRLGLLGTQALAHAGRISDQPTSKLWQQHAADVPKPETSGESTITVRMNPNLARQSSTMSSSQPLPPTGRKPRVFKGRPDSLDDLNAQPPCLQNLDCKALPGLQGDLRGDQKETHGRALSNNELNGPLLSHQNRLGPRYLPLPPRQRLNNRTRKTGYSKFRPNSLDAGKDVRKDNKKPVELTEPIGLLGEFNPGIISRIRDCKQVQAILGAVVGSQAMEATASVRMQRKQMQDRSQAETALSHPDLRNPCEGVAVADWLKESGDDKATASVDRMADVRNNFAMDVGAHSQLGGSSYGRDRKSLESPSPLQGCRAAEDHHQIAGAEVKDDDCKMSQAKDASHSAGHASQMDPKTSGAAATVACRWLELLGMDIKGRLAALKRSRRRFRNAVGSGELDIEVGPLAVPSRGAETDLNPHQHGQKANQWKTLFMNMDGMLSVEGGKLERSLKQVTEMQVNCRQALESSCDPSTSGLSPAERKEREMILAASAASIFSAANFASMLCN